MILRRGQGAFEYILMLSGVLLVVITIIFLLQGTTSSANNTLAAQIKSAGIALDPSYYVPGCKPQFMPNSPADGAGSTNQPNITALITVKDAQLLGLTYNWNGTNYSIYDQSLVLALNFDDANLIGDTASKEVDVSASGNNGTIYGNTALLLHMDENTGQTTYDESRLANNANCYNMGGTGTTNCNWTVGKTGSGIRFDGDNDYAAFPAINAGTNYSIEAWVWPGAASTSDWATIISNNNLPEFGCPPGSLQIQLYNRVAGPSLQRYAWSHVVLTRNQDNYSIYVNGAYATSNITSAGSDTYSIIGAYLPGAALITDREPWNGTIDEVGIYLRPLTGDEVLARYNAGRAKQANWDSNGKWQSAMKFDGIDDYLKMTSLNGFSNLSGTVSIWVLPAKNSTDNRAQYLYENTIPLAYDNFETGGSMAYWTRDGTSIENSNSRTTELAHSGNYSFKMNVTVTSGTYTYYRRALTSVNLANGTYLDGWVYKDPSCTCSIGFGWSVIRTGTCGTHQGNSLIGSATAGAWTRMRKSEFYRTVFEGFATNYGCPPNVTLDGYYINFGGTCTNCAVYVDDAKFTQDGIEIYRDVNGYLYAIIGNTTLSAPANWNSSHHVAITYQNAGAAGLYIDGMLVSSASNVTLPAGLGYDARFGNSLNDTGNYALNGSIDEVRVWSRALSAAEIAMQYRSSLNKYTPNAWFFENRNDNLVAGNTYNYTLYTNGGYRKDSTSETRTVRVCSNPLLC